MQVYNNIFTVMWNLLDEDTVVKVLKFSHIIID